MSIPALTEGSVLSFVAAAPSEAVVRKPGGRATVTVLIGWAVVVVNDASDSSAQATRIEPVVLVDDEALTASQALAEQGLKVTLPGLNPVVTKTPRSDRRSDRRSASVPRASMDIQK